MLSFVYTCYLYILLIPRVTFECQSYNNKFKFFDQTQLPMHNAFSKLNEIIISHCKGYVTATGLEPKTT